MAAQSVPGHNLRSKIFRSTYNSSSSRALRIHSEGSSPVKGVRERLTWETAGTLSGLHLRHIAPLLIDTGITVVAKPMQLHVFSTTPDLRCPCISARYTSTNGYRTFGRI